MESGYKQWIWRVDIKSRYGEWSGYGEWIKSGYGEWI